MSPAQVALGSLKGPMVVWGPALLPPENTGLMLRSGFITLGKLRGRAVPLLGWLKPSLFQRACRMRLDSRAAAQRAASDLLSLPVQYAWGQRHLHSQTRQLPHSGRAALAAGGEA